MTHRAHLAITLGCALWAGCSGLDSLERNVCGNGIIEPGEDCDSSSASCVACAVVCTGAKDCPTADYTCGVDGFCHAPGGGFVAPTTPTGFLADDFRIADIDHDGTGDVLGVSKTSLAVRFGDPAGSLSAATTVATPTQSGSPSFGDIDGDGSLDLTIVTTDGLVSYASRYDTLSPLATVTPLADPGNGMLLDPQYAFTISNTAAVVFAVGGQNQIGIGVFVLSAPTVAVSAVPCNLAIDQSVFTKRQVDVYFPSSRGNDAVVSLVTNESPARACVMSIHVDPSVTTLHPVPTVDIVDITPSAIPANAKKLVLADLDMIEKCPNLVYSDAGVKALKMWQAQSTLGHCDLASVPGALPTPDSSNPPTGATVTGHIPLVPGIPSSPPDALVMTSGIYDYVPSANFLGAIFKSARSLDILAFGDVNGDGQVDLISATEGEGDIDVLFRRGFVLNTFNTFQLTRIDTANQVKTITTGDFDGNQIMDVAYTEADGSHERLMLSYGTIDRPTEPVEMATFDDFISVALLNLFDSTDPFLLVQDLIVFAHSQGQPVATLLHGSPLRTMLSFFDPRDSGSVDKTTFRASIVGNFTKPASGFADVIAIASEPGAMAMDPPDIRAWTTSGTGAGFDSAANQGTDSGVEVMGADENCAVPATVGGTQPASTALCIRTADFLAWPVAADHDVVIAIDRQPTPYAGVADPAAPVGAAISTSALPAITSKVPHNSIERAMYAVDLDGDGNSELVATFGPGPKAAAAGPGVVLVCDVASGVPQPCADVATAVVAVAPDIATCVDAAPGHFAYRDPFTTSAGPGTDLVVLCFDTAAVGSLFRVTRDPAGFHAELVDHGVGALRSIRVGDVTGDGVDDVIAIQGVGSEESLVVFRQCTSRDTTCGKASKR